LKRLLELFFLFLFFSFLSLSLSFFAPSLEDLGVLMIFEEKITSSKTSFQITSIYWRWTHIPEWSYARQYFWVRLANNVGSKSFQKNSKLKWTHHLTKLNTTRVAMWIIFGFGRNVYVVEEPFYFHSTPINLKIKVQQD
jgi:hypothetical protein